MKTPIRFHGLSEFSLGTDTILQETLRPASSLFYSLYSENIATTRDF